MVKGHNSAGIQAHEEWNTGSSRTEPAVPTLCIFAGSELLVLLGVNKGLITCPN